MGAIRTGQRYRRGLRGLVRRKRPSWSRAWYQPGLEQLEPRVLLAINPSGIEQELFQLANRFRADPQGELFRLVNNLSPISSLDPYINQQLVYWGVSGRVLSNQFKDLIPTPPLAWSESLYDSAHDHNRAMLANDGQQHQFPSEPDPGTRMRNSGYDWRRWGENIYAYPRSTVETQGGFVIDWGAGPNGIQDPPNHRTRLLNEAYVHIGVAIDNVGYAPGRSVGPWIVTQDLAAPLTAATPAYVVGAVYTEENGSPWYVAGSGYGNVQIVFEGPTGTFQTTSWSAGGYQIQLPPGTYRGRATGGSLPASLVSDEFVVGLTNVAVDFVNPVDRERIPQAADDAFVSARNTTSTFNVLQNDRDLDGQLMPSTLLIVSGPTAGTIEVDSETGHVTYVPGLDFLGRDKFVYQVWDNDGLPSNLATARIVVADFQRHPWRNPWNALDVNIDDQVSPLDALLIINALNAGGGGELSVPPPPDALPPPLLDVTGDDYLSPLDALQIVNYLNAGASGEGEFSSSDAGGGNGGVDQPTAVRGPQSIEEVLPVTLDAAPHSPADMRVLSQFRSSLSVLAVPDAWGAGEPRSSVAATSSVAAALVPSHRMLRRRDRLAVLEGTAIDEVFRDGVFDEWPQQLVDLRFRS